uniref:Phosphoglycerate mutase (2,3-diphosphoglycerate-dependent) n=1 Tax=viral metagenome TaxID=1070528 RepID=A0A6C0JN28_9ZZZZ
MRIYMSRHGQSTNNVLGIIGGDCHITEKGVKYRDFLGEYFKHTEISVWTSQLIRTKETASSITSNPTEWEDLNEIHSGDFEGLVLDNIRANYPKIYMKRNNDKVNNCYPNGESYIDVYDRVSRVLDQIKESDTILIICHQAVCRTIIAYFTKKPLSECVNIPIDLHTLYELKKNDFIPII